MADKGWKAFERRMARDCGTERIPVTGERHGADCATALFAMQFKLRRVLPAYLWAWLAGIRTNAQAAGKVGVLVVKKPRQQDRDALVVLSWQDWLDLHGSPPAATYATDDQVKVAADRVFRKHRASLEKLVD
jgi:hypothetical protein